MSSLVIMQPNIWLGTICIFVISRYTFSCTAFKFVMLTESKERKILMWEKIASYVIRKGVYFFCYIDLSLTITIIIITAQCKITDFLLLLISKHKICLGFLKAISHSNIHLPPPTTSVYVFLTFHNFFHHWKPTRASNCLWQMPLTIKLDAQAK